MACIQCMTIPRRDAPTPSLAISPAQLSPLNVLSGYRKLIHCLNSATPLMIHQQHARDGERGAIPVLDPLKLAKTALNSIELICCMRAISSRD
jgi:hypothetical protein